MLGRLLRRKTDVEGDEGKHYKKANLGGANKMYFNEELKMWVEMGKEEEARAEKAKQSAPPPSLGSISAASSTTSLNALDAPDLRPPSFKRGKSLADRYRATPAMGTASAGSSGPPSGKTNVPNLPKMPRMPSPAGSTAALPPFSQFRPNPTPSEAASDMAVGSSIAGSISLSQSNLSVGDSSIANSRSGSHAQLWTPPDPEATAAAAAAVLSEGESASFTNGHALAPGQEPDTEGPHALNSSNGDGAVGEYCSMARSETLESSLGGCSSVGMPAMSGNLSFANWQPMSPQALAAQQHEHKQSQQYRQLQRHEAAAAPPAGRGDEPEVTSQDNISLQQQKQQQQQPAALDQQQQQQQPPSGAHHQHDHHNGGYQQPQQQPFPAVDSNGNGVARHGSPDDQEDSDNNWGPPGYAAGGAPVSAIDGMQDGLQTYGQDSMWPQAAGAPLALAGTAGAVDAEGGGAGAGWSACGDENNMWQEPGREGAASGGWEASGAAEGGHAEAWHQPHAATGGSPTAVDPLAGSTPYEPHSTVGYNEAEQQYYNYNYYNYQHQAAAAAAVPGQQHMDVSTGFAPYGDQPSYQQYDQQQQQQGAMVPELLEPVHPELPGITTITPAIGSGDYAVGSAAAQATGAAAAGVFGSSQNKLIAPGSAPHAATSTASGSGAAVTVMQGSTPVGTSSSSNSFIPSGVSPSRTTSLHASAGSLLLPPAPLPRSSMPGLTGSSSSDPPGSALLTLPTPAVAGDVSMLTVVRPSSPYARPVSPLQRTSTGMSEASGSGGSGSQQRGFALPSPPASTAAFVKPGPSAFVPGGTPPGQQLQQRPSTTGSSPWLPPGGGGASLDAGAGSADQQHQQPWQPPSVSGTGSALMPNGFFTPQPAGSGGTGPWIPGQQQQQQDQSSSSKDRDKRHSGKAVLGGFTPASAGQQEWPGSRLQSHPYDQFVTRELSNINWKARHFKQPGKLNKLVPWEELEMKQEQEKEQKSHQRQQQGQGSPGSRKDAFWYRQMEHRQKLPQVMKQSASEPVAMPSHIAATRPAAAAAAASAQQGLVASPGPAHTAQPALFPSSNQADWQGHQDNYWQHAGAYGGDAAAAAAAAASSAFATPNKELPAASDASVGAVLGSGAGSASVGEPTPTSRYVPSNEGQAEGGEPVDVAQRLDYSSTEVQEQNNGHPAQQGTYSGYYGMGQDQQQYWQQGADGTWQQQGEAQQWQQVTQDSDQQCYTADTGFLAHNTQSHYAQSEQQQQQQWEQHYEQLAARVPGQETATGIEQEAQRQQQPGVAGEAGAGDSLLPAAAAGGADASSECPVLSQDLSLQLDAEAAVAADAAGSGWDVDDGAFEELGLRLDDATPEAVTKQEAVVVQQQQQFEQPEAVYVAHGPVDVLTGHLAGEAIAQPDTAKAAAAAAQLMVGQALDSIMQQHMADSVDGVVGVTSTAGTEDACGEVVAAVEHEQLSVLNAWQLETAEAAAAAAAAAADGHVEPLAGEGDAPEASYASAAYPQDWLRLRSRFVEAAAGYEGDAATFRDYFLQYGDYLLVNMAEYDGGADGEGGAAGKAAAAGSSGTAEAEELQEALEMWGESQLKSDVNDGCFASMNMDLGLVLSELALS